MTGYLDVVRKGWAWIFTFVVLGGCAGYGIALETAKTYQAEAQLFVATHEPSNPDDVTSASEDAIGVAQSLPAFATSPMVTSYVVSKLGLHTPSSQLAGQIAADATSGKALINIRVKDADPIMAARLTNAVTARFIDVTSQVFQRPGSRRPQYSLTTVRHATVPTNAVSPNRQLYAEAGLLAGLALGLVVVSLGGVRRTKPDEPAQAVAG